MGSGTLRGEEGEEEDEEEDENEGDGGDGKKTKEDQTPLWKNVTKLGGGKGGGTTKVVCPHCNITYTGSYPRVRKHISSVMPWDGNKTIGVKLVGNANKR